MRIPTKFFHKGKLWRVIDQANLHADDGTEALGLTDLDKRIIYIDPSLKGKRKREIFYHELFHAVIYEAHIAQNIRFSEGIEEVLCDAFSDLLVNSFTNLKWKKRK